MKSETMVAKEIQDLAAATAETPVAVRELAAALTVAAAQAREAKPPEVAAPMLQIAGPTFNVPQVAPPDVVVNVPQQAAPTVNVESPTVNVAAPRVTIQAPGPVAYQVEITKRDKDGLIEAFVMYPVQIAED